LPACWYATLGGRLFSHIKSSLLGIRDVMLNVRQSLDFRLRVRVERKDEVGETAEAFNALLQQLQAVSRTYAAVWKPWIRP
jgi:methyl-accepting chemotaxis protein